MAGEALAEGRVCTARVRGAQGRGGDAKAARILASGREAVTLAEAGCRAAGGSGASIRPGAESTRRTRYHARGVQGPRHGSHAMKRHLAHRLGAVLLVLLPFAVCAQEIPRPREFYFEVDSDVTRPLQLYPGSDDATVERLLKARERGRRGEGALASAQLAQIAYASGRAETGAALYSEARARADGARMRDALHWNHGWDLYRSGDFAGALQQWRSAGAERLKGPSWLPPTLALGLWKLDRKDEAVRWYAAAVRTEPRQWQAPDLAQLLPGWSAADRAVLAEVAAAWQANPPSWP